MGCELGRQWNWLLPEETNKPTLFLTNSFISPITVSVYRRTMSAKYNGSVEWKMTFWSLSMIKLTYGLVLFPTLIKEWCTYACLKPWKVTDHNPVACRHEIQAGWFLWLKIKIATYVIVWMEGWGKLEHVSLFKIEQWCWLWFIFCSENKL